MNRSIIVFLYLLIMLLYSDYPYDPGLQVEIRLKSNHQIIFK